MSTYASRDELDKGRKDLAKITKQIGDLVVKQREIQEGIHAYEKNCRHIWSKRKYIEKNDSFERTCDLCGQVKTAKE